VRRCTLLRCDGRAAAVVVKGNARLKHCSVQGSGSGGVFVEVSGRAKLKHCVIVGGGRSGVVAWGREGSAGEVWMRGCTLSANAGQDVKERGSGSLRTQ